MNWNQFLSACFANGTHQRIRAFREPVARDLREAAALLRLADLFVGPDSGPMNLAVAGATPAFVLFGSTPVLDYSRFIHAIEPDDGLGRSSNGMASSPRPTAASART